MTRSDEQDLIPVRVIWADPIERRYVLEVLRGTAPSLDQEVWCETEDGRQLPAPGIVIERRNDSEFTIGPAAP
jgi:hypothetical protein